MTIYIAFLRAVNVGGTGKLPMSELKSICERAGFKNARTYIASGNVVFENGKTEKEVKALLEEELYVYANKAVDVLVRTSAELKDILARNPFPNEAPNRTVAVFLDEPPTVDALETITGKQDEVLRLGTREIYVHYGNGMANSKLKIPSAKKGTARNINTTAKLVSMATS